MERLLGLKRLNAKDLVAELRRHEDVAVGYLSRSSFAQATLAAVGVDRMADVDDSTRDVLNSVFDVHDATRTGRASTLALAGAMSVFCDHNGDAACSAFFPVCGYADAEEAAEGSVRDFVLAVFRM